MAQHDALLHQDTVEYLARHERKSLLRFITCGSVDDGKSTLIGRLLYETHMIFDDQMQALEADSKRVGTRGEALDFALLVDGLAAEREQGITIDVAYRFFTTDKRKFIVADAPGHEQYTRNMATGASNADVAVLLIDARKGVLPQTRRHLFIASLLGVPRVVLCINKMDLAGWDEQVFRSIEADFSDLAGGLGIDAFDIIPVCATDGDNIAERSTHTPWYSGPTLLTYLETVDLTSSADEASARFPVQWVNRPDETYRGYCGRLEAGTLSPGQDIVVQPSGAKAAISRIVTMDGDQPQAFAGQSVSLVLDRDVDVSRGDVIAPSDAPSECADQFQAKLVWMALDAMLPGRRYWLKSATNMVPVTISNLKHRIDIHSFEDVAAKTLELNDIGTVTLSLEREIAFEPYQANKALGGFILIDRESNETVGAGMIDFALRRASNIHRQDLTVDKQARSVIKGQKPVVLWFTGLSGSGKSTIADEVSRLLQAGGHHTMLLDGDNVRHGLNRDLGFTDVDRVENIRRIAEVSRLMVDAGLITLVAFISPFRAERALARSLVKDSEFVEIFVDTPLVVAESRDVKGLYRKARAGELVNFTGIDSPYEEPLSPDIHLRTVDESVEDAALRIVDWLGDGGYLTP